MNEVVNDPWVVQEVKSKGVPAGNYMAVFKGVQDFKIPATGEDRWRWAWQVKSGEHTGSEASTLSDKNINANVRAGRIVAGLLGRAIKVGDNVKALIDDCIGKTYLIGVGKGIKDGAVGVQTVGQLPPM
jgi:hypothetical protein